MREKTRNQARRERPAEVGRDRPRKSVVMEEEERVTARGRGWEARAGHWVKGEDRGPSASTLLGCCMAAEEPCHSLKLKRGRRVSPGHACRAPQALQAGSVPEKCAGQPRQERLWARASLSEAN
jgi:hypothetical protein